MRDGAEDDVVVLRDRHSTGPGSYGNFPELVAGVVERDLAAGYGSVAGNRRGVGLRHRAARRHIEGGGGDRAQLHGPGRRRNLHFSVCGRNRTGHVDAGVGGHADIPAGGGNRRALQDVDSTSGCQRHVSGRRRDVYRRIVRLADCNLIAGNADVQANGVRLDFDIGSGQRNVDVALAIRIGVDHIAKPRSAAGRRILDASDGAGGDDFSADVLVGAAFDGAPAGAFARTFSLSALGLLAPAGEVEGDRGAVRGGSDGDGLRALAAERRESDFAGGNGAGIFDGLADEVRELAGVDAALVHDASGTQAGNDESVRTVLGVFRGGGDEAAHVDLRACAEENAVGVEDVDLVARQLAENVGPRASGHLVHRGAGTGEFDRIAVRDAEIVPFAGRVGKGHRLSVRRNRVIGKRRGSVRFRQVRAGHGASGEHDEKARRRGDGFVEAVVHEGPPEDRTVPAGGAEEPGEITRRMDGKLFHGVVGVEIVVVFRRWFGGVRTELAASRGRGRTSRSRPFPWVP